MSIRDWILLEHTVLMPSISSFEEKLRKRQ